jgi:hypothetical protein
MAYSSQCLPARPLGIKALTKWSAQPTTRPPPAPAQPANRRRPCARLRRPANRAPAPRHAPAMASAELGLSLPGAAGGIVPVICCGRGDWPLVATPGLDRPRRPVADQPAAVALSGPKPPPLGAVLARVAGLTRIYLGKDLILLSPGLSTHQHDISKFIHPHDHLKKHPPASKLSRRNPVAFSVRKLYLATPHLPPASTAPRPGNRYGRRYRGETRQAARQMWGE